MDILGLMQSLLYLIMNALLYPVILLLIFLVAAALYALGSFISELVLRRQENLQTDHYSEHLAAQVSNEVLCGRFESAAELIKKHFRNSDIKSRLLRDFMQDFALQVGKGKDNLDIRAEKTLRQYEIEVTAHLDKTRMMTRIGPMLGLMGTLIPMGPALLSLSKGDLTQMANSLIIAFGTTVAGLAVGALGYLISVYRERWYAQDVKDMEYVVDLLVGHIEDSRQPVQKMEEQNALLHLMSRR